MAILWSSFGDHLGIARLKMKNLYSESGFSHGSSHVYPLVMTNSLLLKMTIEIVDFPSYNLVIFHSYVKLPEGRFQDDTRFPGSPF